ncbi:MAG: hypothetical protein M1396_01105 [Chloroflexi bacterium]|nr:hypothetical protein [Chloroflexota bacterium]MCL5947528.1 hypothetical protein [Chloroflexota bacterium]
MNGFLGPFLVRELQSGLRSGRRILLLSAVLLTIATLFCLVYALVHETASTTTGDIGIGTAIFPYVVGLNLGVLCAVAPASSARAIAYEREQHTLELLRVAPIGIHQLVLGEFIASSAFPILLLIALLPIDGLAYLLGGATWQELGIALILLIGSLVLFVSLGLLISSLSAGVRPAIAATYTTIGLLTLGLPVLGLLGSPLVDSWLRSSSPMLVAHPPPLLLALGEIVVAIDPWIAGSIGLAQIQRGSSLLTLTASAGLTQTFLPAPWLLFGIESCVLSALCLKLAARVLTRPPRKLPV